MAESRDHLVLAKTLRSDQITRVEVHTLGKQFQAQNATYRDAPNWTYNNDLIIDLVMQDQVMANMVLDKYADSGGWPDVEIAFFRKYLPERPAMLKFGSFCSLNQHYATIMGRIDASNFTNLFTQEIISPSQFSQEMEQAKTLFSRRLLIILEED